MTNRKTHVTKKKLSAKEALFRRLLAKADLDSRCCGGCRAVNEGKKN